MIRAKIADTPYTQEQGLMFVQAMPEDEGMLFVWKRPQKLSFWGQNTFIPLDIAFIDERHNIVKLASIEPHSLKAVTSDHYCPFALEVNAGYFAQQGIKVGDRLKITDPPRLSSNLEREYGIALIDFEKEGQTSILEKDVNSYLWNFKQSQTATPGQPIVEKPDQTTVGEPITESVGNKEIPIIDVSQLGGILEDNKDDVPEQPEGQPEQQEEAPQEPQKEYPVFSSAFQAAEWAKQNSEVMRISYTTKHGRSLIRDVEPHGMFHSESTQRQILVTFDETVNEIRAFILSNVSKWAFTGKQFDKKFVVKA